jgi:hypothetical protein
MEILYKNKNKVLYSDTIEGGSIQTQLRYSLKTNCISIMNRFFKNKEAKSKNLYVNVTDHIRTKIQLQYSVSTDHIGFTTLFTKANNGTSETNKVCTQFLGIHIAERVLSKIFKDVEVFPYGHKGYDFICNKGFKIDVKSATKRSNRNKNAWVFNIKKNQIPDYFLCLAFDNRKDLNPKYLWLINGNKINDKNTLSISLSKRDEWKQYELTDKLKDVISCCNIIRRIL